MRRIRRLSRVLLAAMLCFLLSSFSVPTMAFTDAKYYIEVDIGNQIVTIYDADTMNIVRQMLCSAGKKEHWTPVGDYIMQADERRSDRDPWYKIGDIYVRYATRLYGPVLFHSIPYYAKKTDCIDRDAVKLLGFPASHGCIRLRWQDARFIAENCGPGTRVKVLRSEKRDDELRALLLQETYDASKGVPYESFLGISDDPNVMDRHSTGQAVLDLQYRLRDLGVYDGEINGEYGSTTINAVRYAQYLLGGDATGLATPDFIEAIFREDAPTAMNVPLQSGMSGPAVRQLQANLKALRLFNDDLDSVYDTAVVDAVRQFQRAYGYEENGVADPTLQKAVDYEAGRVAETFGESDYSCAWTGEPVLLARVSVREEINLRQSASQGSEQVRKLPPNKLMIVEKRGDNWSRVRVGSDEGYVNNGLVAFSQRVIARLEYTSATEDLVYTIGNDMNDYLAGAELPCEVFEAYLATNDQQVKLDSLENYVTVTTGDGDAPLNLRAMPDGDSAVLDTVKNGENLRVLRRTSDWTLVNYGGQSGYLMNRYLKFWTGLKDALETHEEVEADQAVESGYAVVASATDRRAAVYEADLDDAKVLGHLPDGTLLEVVSTTGSWCRIRYKGHEGYMIGDDLMMQST